MEKSSRKRGPPGVTLVELVVAITVLVFVGVLVSKMIRIPNSLQRMTGSVDAERALTHATDLFVNDLHEASAASIDWDTVPQAPPVVDPTLIFGITFSLPHFDPVTPTSTTIHYQYVPVPGTTQGTLVRTLEPPSGAGATTSKVVLSYLDPPTVDVPLVYVDTSTYHVLILQLFYHPPGQPVLKSTRRISLKG